jgi:DNA polymerase-3 subunit alpha
VRYVSVHSHCTYSYGDGFELPEKHVKRVHELGMRALAMTDHGNVSSHVKLEQACLEIANKDDDGNFVSWNVKPIFGLEAYCAPGDMRETANQRKWHMTILAMNQPGYQNLMRLVTASWSPDNFYRWPTVTGRTLADNQEGLICTSGCADSHLACTLLGGKGRDAPTTPRQVRRYYDDAVRVMLGYKKMLGDRYYLEVQRFPGLARTCELNAQYAAWSKEFDIPLVASSDVHYPHPEQNEMQKILHAASRNTGTVAAAEAGWEYDILLTYPQSDDEILNDLIRTGLTRGQAQAAVENTARIAERCNVSLPKMDRLRYPGTRRDLLPWAPPAARKGR